MKYDELLKLIGQQTWKHFLTRPFSLFGTSLWNYWYSEGTFRSLFNYKRNYGLFIEENKNLVRHYWTPHELQDFRKSIKNAVNDPAFELIEKIRLGLKYNNIARKTLETGGNKMDFAESVNFLDKVIVYEGMLPYFALEHINKDTPRYPEISKNIESLRMQSSYQLLLNKLVKPGLRHEFKNKKINPEYIDFITIREALSGKYDEFIIQSRAKFINKNHRFVYLAIQNEEKIHLTNKIAKITDFLEPQIKLRSKISGKIAYKGQAKGYARIVSSHDGAGILFNKGDILIAPSTNPSLIHLIKKAGAIVTDEGGITSHAAIISRELKKPCIIGTKIATKIINNGNMIFVDAIKGEIRIF